MGASFNYYTHEDNPSVKELKERFEEEREEAGWEYGKGGYSGSLYEKSGLTILDKTFENEDEAYNYLEENNCKWENAWAVPYKAVVNVDSTKKAKASQALEKVIGEREKLIKDGVSAIKNTKSKTIGCKNCGSSVNRKYVKNFDCVVCHHTNAYLTPTLSKRIEAKSLKITALKATLNKLNNDTKKEVGVHYIIGGWCSC